MPESCMKINENLLRVQITDDLLGKLFEILYVFLENTDNNFRFNTSIIMNDYISELCHFHHCTMRGFRNYAIFKKDNK